MALRARNSAVQLKTEVTEGVDPGGWLAADVLPTNELSAALNPDQIQLDEFGGSLDRGPTIPGALRPTVTVGGYLRGSGTPATPPGPFSAALAAGALTPTLLAAPIPATGTTDATGGTTTTATLDRTIGNGTEWPSTSGLASGMIGTVIELDTNPTVTTRAPVVDYQVVGNIATITFGFKFAVALSATTNLKRLVQTLWRAASPMPHPSVFLRTFYDGLMETFAGARPSISFNCENGQPGRFSFPIGGQYVGRSDVAVPVAPSTLLPPVMKNGICSITGGALAAQPLAIRTISIDTGNEGQYPDNVNQPSGLDPYIIGARRIAGSIDPQLVLTAGGVDPRDLVAFLQAGTSGTICFLLGPRTGATQLGNRFAFTIRDVAIGDASIGADNLVRRETVPYSSGSFNDGLIISHH